ncbi:MAG: hypothetical protein V4807_16930 [Burkholderia gladioli]|uniref:hydrolase n=1 Tax=Burkholderia gladioli TaxID=28095 RepID=UPI001640E1F9|nr:hydrolase [Burkholderia gladioli]
MYALRTIDVWDTLLRRDCHPEFAKLATALHVFLDPSLDVASRHTSVWDVYRLRVEQEIRLADEARAAGRDNEYEISEVLQRWLASLIERPVDLMQAQQLADREFAFELRHTYPDPTIREFAAQYPAERTLFLSDFYMSAERLAMLLRHHGIDTFVPEGISSCDVGINKRSGKLFHHVETLHGVTPREHIHIGDNLTADLEVPSAMGISAIHFLPEVEHAHRQRKEAVFDDRATLFRRIQSEAVAAPRRSSDSSSTRRESAFLAGLQASALLVGFCLDIAERAISSRIERLYFFAREGEFFIRVWRALFPDNLYAGHQLPQASLLEVSRLATFCASLGEVTPNEMRRIWSLYTTHSLEALLASLGLDASEFKAMAARHHLSLSEPLHHPAQDPRIGSLFEDSEFVHAIEAKVRIDRESLLAYLTSQGLRNESSHVGVVDIGWRGTIQDNLARLLPAVRFEGSYLGLLAFLNDQPINSFKRAYGPDANRSSKHVALLDAVSPIEMLCSSSKGSVRCYRLNDNGSSVTVSRMDSDMAHADSEQFVEAFQDGVVAAASVWAGHIEICSIKSDELREPALSIWTQLLVNPQQGLVEAYTVLNQNDVFGAGQFVSKRNVPSLGKLCLGIVSSRARREVILYIRQTQWVAGVRGREDLSLLHRLALTAVLRLALGYKRVMQARAARRRTVRS